MPGMKETHGIFTIGHSNLAYDDFFALLTEHRIQLIADVRSQPYSRYVPHFNREAISVEAERRGFTYRFMGESLGGRPGVDSGEEHTTPPDYDAMAKKPELLNVLRELVSQSRSTSIALMCSEGDPAACHRTKLLGKVVEARFGIPVLHITQGKLVAQSELCPEQLSLL